VRVLIVDDEMLIRRAIARILEKKGHEVKLAADGLEGFTTWQKFKPQLVFLDVLMPGLTGPELLKKMGSNHGARVVLMSAYSGEEDIENFEKLGIETFLQKPFNDIYATIDQMEKLIK
jgi:CheY-like chemotaxis protein